MAAILVRHFEFYFYCKKLSLPPNTILAFEMGWKLYLKPAMGQKPYIWGRRQNGDFYAAIFLSGYSSKLFSGPENGLCILENPNFDVLGAEIW